MTATLEIDQTVLQILKTKAKAEGLSPDAFLRKLLAGENGGASSCHPEISLAEASPVAISVAPAKPQLTPYQMATAKGLLGAVDSSVLNPDSPPIHTEFGQYLLEEYEKQLEELTKPH